MAQRLPDWLPATCVFLYPTEEEAEKGLPNGGSGFFVGLPWESDPQYVHIYVVTNKHVIEPPSGGRSAVVMRFNLREGGVASLLTAPDEWRFPKSGDDLAVRLTPLDNRKVNYSWEKLDRLITDEIIAEYQLGIGDEVFSAGRFLDIEDANENRPIVRFGQVASMAAVPIRWNKTWSQPSYLVEMRSRTGFSGSAVYIYIDPSHAGQIVNRPATYDTTTNVKFSVPRICGPWLLGVHWAQLPVSGPDATEAERTEPKSYASGVSAVVPGQILKRFLLEDEQLKRERKVIEDEWKSRPHAVLETAAEVAPPTDNPSHKEDFTRL